MAHKSSKKLPVHGTLSTSQRAVLTPPLPIISVPAPRLVGYARVSTEDQSLDMQTAMLIEAGVNPDEDLFVEKLSAVIAKRPQFHVMMKHLWAGDTLLVYSMSRLARDVRALFKILDELKALGVTVQSLTEPHLDLKTAQGRMILTIQAAVDQNEREQLQARTKHGMAERKRQGQYMGRPRRITDKDKAEMKRLRKTMPAAAIAKRFGIAVPTVYLYTK